MGLEVMFGIGVRKRKLGVVERELIIRLFKNGKKQEGIAEESGGVQSALRLVVGFVLGRREGRSF